MFSNRKWGAAGLLVATLLLGLAAGYLVGVVGNGRYEMYIGDYNKYVFDTRTGTLKSFYTWNKEDMVKVYQFNPQAEPE